MNVVGATIDDALTVRWDDGSQTRFGLLWVRDHSHDPTTIHPVTKQRLVSTAALAANLQPVDVTLVADAVVVRWTAGPDSVLPTTFLRQHRTPRSVPAGLTVDPQLWHNPTELGELRIGFADVMESDSALRTWLEMVAAFGFAIVEATPSTFAATEALIRRVAYVRETIFGGMWEFTDDLSKADTAYTNMELAAHTDGTYSHDAPGLQMLHCLHFDGTGGESTVVDGFAIAHQLAEIHPELALTLQSVDITGQYVGDGAHLVASRPVVRCDRSGRVRQVSYNSADRAPIANEDADAVYDALLAFDALANDSGRQWRHRLGVGEAMLFDNWRVLHGRCGYTGQRHMCGGYLNHEDFESRLRTLHTLPQ